MLTVTEASAVNTLAAWILGRPRWEGPLPSDQDARAALETLAGSSHKRLMAGIDGGRVAERWDSRRLRVKRNEEPRR